MKTTRRIVQFGFLALVLVGVFVVEGNAERWCPFGGVEALYTYFTEGNMLCSLGISNFYILGAVLLITLILRRVFCGYMCPIGTISEWLQSGSRRILKIKPVRVPVGVDRCLSLLKYVVLGIVLYFTWTMSELEFRRADPCYALISRHGEDITYWAYIVAGTIVAGSLFVTIPFCRWLCPLGAVLNIFSKVGLSRVKRDPESCINCGLCAKVCPTAIPVDKQLQVTNARCLSCLNCVEVCPERKNGALRWGPTKNMRVSWPQSVLVLIILVAVTAAVVGVNSFPAPAYSKVIDGRGSRPATAITLDLKVFNLSCRGKASLLSYYLDRDDMYELSGYLKAEAWPGSGAVDLIVTYDPEKTDRQAILEALTEPYYDRDADMWRPSPFEIEGYDPLDLGD